MKTTIPFHSKAAQKDTTHTYGLLAPHLRAGDVILDIGCGPSYTTAYVAEQGFEVFGVDIVDSRRVPIPNFALYDGVRLDYPDDRFDVVMLNFVLHHVPNPLKARLVAEAVRVARRYTFILEDTPKNWFDRYFNNRHGRKHRGEIGSDADFGFYSEAGWRSFFAEQRLDVVAHRSIGRMERDWAQPYARSMFVVAPAPAGQ